MAALAFLLKATSSIGNRMCQSLKSVFVAMCESQMQRAKIEIDRYHRMHTSFESSEDAAIDPYCE